MERSWDDLTSLIAARNLTASEIFSAIMSYADVTTRMGEFMLKGWVNVSSSL
jgi:hypothetical protein